jgi:N-acetylglucosaminyldiphosphoundecaprenol N-acetyl-beta-D-mannosaminyltransferase
MKDALSILGVSVSAIDYDQTIKKVQTWIHKKTIQYVCVVNVHSIMECVHNPDVMKKVNQAGLRVPDGTPLVWLLQKAGYPITQRVYGPTLMLKLLGVSQTKNYSVFFVGGALGESKQFQTMIHQQFPHLKIVGHEEAPTRPLSSVANKKIIQQINKKKPDLVFVGLGCPHQEKWMAEQSPKMRQGVLIGVGAAFDFITGRVRQAPIWMQESGLEWLFRFTQDPRRLWYRYTVLNLQFCLMILFHKRKEM